MPKARLGSDKFQCYVIGFDSQSPAREARAVPIEPPRPVDPDGRVWLLLFYVQASSEVMVFPVVAWIPSGTAL